jgi:rfaE bifunctional protein nucleotidyltransferase chain/domain
VFDVLHRGHVTYLAHARALGGSLVVALNTDASARRLGKGPDRPLNNEEDRAIMMAALESVSLVTWFDEDTPLELITELRPDLLVKGGDYDMDTLAETAVVKAYGGKAQAIPFVDGYSTTALVKKSGPRRAVPDQAALAISTALEPPNAKELDITARRPLASRGVSGT